jgi:hypothetical protein
MRGSSRLEFICDQKKLAYEMAHSYSTQSEYWKDISELCEEVMFNESWSRRLFARAGRPKITPVIKPSISAPAKLIKNKS